MHFPEEQLRTYLRVFMPEDRLDEVLDEIARAAIESEVEDQMELFALAHWLMDADERRTDGMEAVALVEEVGLPVDEVAYVLDIQVSDVLAAVDAAWAEAATDTGAGEEGDLARDTVDAGETVDDDEGLAGAADDGQDAAAASGTPTAAAWSTEAPPATRRPRRPPRWVWVVVPVTLALSALGVAAFSETGQARLNAVGIDPVIIFLVILGFIGGGAALDRAGSAPRGDGAQDEPPPDVLG